MREVTRYEDDAGRIHDTRLGALRADAIAALIRASGVLPAGPQRHSVLEAANFLTRDREAALEARDALDRFVRELDG